MLACFACAAAASFTQVPAPARHSCSRHRPVVARDITFAAELQVGSEPFTLGSKPLTKWFAQPEALSILMSQAESSRRLDDGDVTAISQQWEVVTPIQFPGMVARSETPMDISIDSTLPQLTITSGQSRTVCEGGPRWATGLLSRIGNIATTCSSNVVSVVDMPGGDKKVVSKVALTVHLRIPGLLLPPFLPVGPFEKAGSESIQKLLEKDMPLALAKFRDAYTDWAA
jgi:hypothetical protein